MTRGDYNPEDAETFLSDLQAVSRCGAEGVGEGGLSGNATALKELDDARGRSNIWPRSPPVRLRGPCLFVARA